MGIKKSLPAKQYDSTTTTSHLLDASSATATVATIKSSDGIAPSRRRMAQNYLLVWVDSNYNETNKDCQDTVAQLRSVVNDVIIHTKPDECIQFLHQVNEEKVFVIISGSLGEQLIPNIHSMSNIVNIYIFCEDKARHEEWTKTWMKIKGVHTDIMDICKVLQLVVKQCNRDSIAVSFVPKNEAASVVSLNELDPVFMYTQILKKILPEMKHEKQAISDLASYCRQFYFENPRELNIIAEFGHSYHLEAAIWWYTRACFAGQMLNRALRVLDGNTIINMGFFIHDLHEQISALYQQQLSQYQGKS